MKKILLQFDTDHLPSSFDGVVAVDSGIDHLFSYGDVSSDNVTGLVHGAIFTRGPNQLANTAIFIGGSRVQSGEAVARQVQKDFFGPMRVSVMMDSNGCNTTAAAAVVAATQHLDPSCANAVVLGGTGPVGQRVAQLLAKEGAQVKVVSRSLERAESVCSSIRDAVGECNLVPVAASGEEDFRSVCQGQQLVVAAGAAGICFLPKGTLESIEGLRVAVDLNAVPPTGLADIAATDKGVTKGDVTCYGALGVGGTKMKVHRQAIASLFEANDRVLDTAEIYELAREVTSL